MADLLPQPIDPREDQAGHIRLMGGPYNGKVIPWVDGEVVKLERPPPLFGREPPRPPYQGRADDRLHIYQRSVRSNVFLYKGFQ